MGFTPSSRPCGNFILNELLAACADERRQLKELEKLGPKMKGIGDYSAHFHGFYFFCFVLFLFTHTKGVPGSSFFYFCLPVSQTVKEVLQSLVDDSLVQTDKIGSSNCRFVGLALHHHPWCHIKRRMRGWNWCMQSSGASLLRGVRS